MEKKFLVGLLVGMNVALMAVMLAGIVPSGNAIAAMGDVDAERYLAVGVEDGAANKSYLYVLDSKNQQLMLYDQVGGKIRLSSIRKIQHDSTYKIKEWETESKKGGSVVDMEKISKKD